MNTNSKEITIRCPKCGEKVVRSESGDVVIRSRIIIIRPNSSVAFCKNCGKEIEIPLCIV